MCVCVVTACKNLLVAVCVCSGTHKDASIMRWWLTLEIFNVSTATALAIAKGEGISNSSAYCFLENLCIVCFDVASANEVLKS